MRLLLSLLFCISILTTVLPQGNGYVVKRSTYIKAYANKIVKEEQLLLQIEDKDAQWLGDISIPQYGNTNVHITEAQIEDLSGKVIRKLKNKEISTESYVSNIALYEDDMVKNFQLVHNQFPYRIRYSYSTSYREQKNEMYAERTL